MFRTILLAIVATAALAAPSYADDDDGPSLDDIPHVTTIGTAEIDARPDLATITVGVTGEQPTAKQAAADVAKHANAVIDAAKTLGVPAIDIATQSVSLVQTFDPIKDGNGNTVGQRPRGFAAETVVALKMRDLDKTSALAEALIAAGANRFDGVTFSVEHPEPIIAKLTGLAVRNARSQAESAAEAGGVRLGRILLIERPGAGEATSKTSYNRIAAAASPSVPFEPGTRSYTVSMEVTWAIEKR